ncbi:hypothetical protein ABE10_01575, partial [Bacillus toyonensis]|nr:hypothetical protein [Bacillus toyonensis]
RPAVRERALGADRADQLGGLPQRAVGGIAVRLVRLADRERLGQLQQPPAARLLHDGVPRRASCCRDRIPDVRDVAEEGRTALEGLPGRVGARGALPRDALLRGIHRRARGPGDADRVPPQPQPHVRRAGCG